MSNPTPKPPLTTRQAVDATVRSYMAHIGRKGGAASTRRTYDDPEKARAAAHARWRNARQTQSRELSRQALRRAARQAGGQAPGGQP
jgi:hypothetical protein